MGLKTGILDADIYGRRSQSCSACAASRGAGETAHDRADGTLRRESNVDRFWSRKTSHDLARADGDQAITQMLRDVAWGDLDILVDLPPGTGDAQLTMAQQAPLSVP